MISAESPVNLGRKGKVNDNGIKLLCNKHFLKKKKIKALFFFS